MKDRLEELAIIATIMIGVGMMSTQCSAADWLISPGGLSIHEDRSAGYRESNPGILIERRDGDHSIVGGRFRNSFNANSRIAAYRYRAVEYAGFGLGGAIGLVDGYPAGGGGPRPVATPALSYDYQRVSILVMAIPPVSKHIEGWTAMAALFVHFFYGSSCKPLPISFNQSNS